MEGNRADAVTAMQPGFQHDSDQSVSIVTDGDGSSEAAVNVEDFPSWRIARELISRHGATAPQVAHATALDASLHGDVEGIRLWKCVAAKACIPLRQWPPANETIARGLHWNS